LITIISSLSGQNLITSINQILQEKQKTFKLTSRWWLLDHIRTEFINTNENQCRVGTLQKYLHKIFVLRLTSIWTHESVGQNLVSHRYEFLAWRRDAVDRASLLDQYLLCQHRSVEQKNISVKWIDTEFPFTLLYIAKAWDKFWEIAAMRITNGFTFLIFWECGEMPKLQPVQLLVSHAVPRLSRANGDKACAWL